MSKRVCAFVLSLMLILSMTVTAFGRPSMTRPPGTLQGICYCTPAVGTRGAGDPPIVPG